MPDQRPLLPFLLILSTICAMGASSGYYDNWVEYTLTKSGETVAQTVTLPGWVSLEGAVITHTQPRRGLAWLKWLFLLLSSTSAGYAYFLSQKAVKTAEQEVVSDFFNKKELIGQSQIQMMANLQTYAEVAQLRAAERYREELLPYLEATQEVEQKLLQGQSLEDIIDPKDKITSSPEADKHSSQGETKEPEPKQPNLPTGYFNWQDLKERDRHPIIRIVGRMGDGKTRLTEWLLSWISPLVYVLAPKINPPKHKNERPDWFGYRVYGAKPALDYDLIEAKLLDLKEEIKKRFTESYRQPEIMVALDDWTYTCRAKDTIKNINLEIVTNARGAGIGEIMLVHSDNAPASGLDGFADLKEVCTTIRLGKFALNHCLTLARKHPEVYEPVYHWLKTQKRPCLVDEFPAVVPDLSDFLPPMQAMEEMRDSLEKLVQKTPASPIELLRLHFQDFLTWGNGRGWLRGFE